MPAFAQRLGDSQLAAPSGDWAFGLGFINSAVLIGGLLIIAALLHYFTDISDTLLFWIAFVLTRPFGATFGDLLTKPNASGGLNLGTIGSSLFFGALLLIAIAKENKLERGRRNENAVAFRGKLSMPEIPEEA